MGCVSTSMYAPKTPCSKLIPDEYRERTEHAAAPLAGAVPLETLKNWIAFGVAQTANVETSDDKRIGAIQIIERCEERDRQAIEEADQFDLLGLRD